MSRRRTQFEPLGKQLTREELKKLEAELMAKEVGQLQIEYSTTHHAASGRFHLPSPRLMQELVTIWKVLRKRGVGPRRLDRNS